MHNVQEIAPQVYEVGGNDRRLALFENMFPLPNGISYNSYLILDEKVALMDTVDAAISRQFFENIEHVLDGHAIDYLVVNHIEPDHSAGIDELCRRFPKMRIVGNAKTFQLLRQFYDGDFDGRLHEVKDGGELSLGVRSLRFVAAPMVHWPEVMMSYEQTGGLLFSADAFGSFGALSGSRFADGYDFEGHFLGEARRYYTNIVGRYGAQVQAAFRKLDGLRINMICPLHGPIWRRDIPYILEKYGAWSRYAPEKRGVVVAYASMYGNTESAANAVAGRLAAKGVQDMRLYDVSKTHPSYIIADIFKYSHLILASPTYNMGLYLPMETLLRDMAALNLRGRKTALIANGSWAPAAHTAMERLLGEMKDMELLAPTLMIKSALKPEQRGEAYALADAVAASVLEQG